MSLFDVAPPIEPTTVHAPWPAARLGRSLAAAAAAGLCAAPAGLGAGSDHARHRRERRTPLSTAAISRTTRATPRTRAQHRSCSHAQLGVRCVAKLDLAESAARFFLSSSRRKKRASHSSFADERIQSENHGGQPPRIISLQARVEHQAMGAKLEGRQAGGRAHLGRGWDLASVKAAAELDEVSLLLGGGLSTHRCMQTTQRVCMGTRYSTGCVATRQTVGCVQDG